MRALVLALALALFHAEPRAQLDPLSVRSSSGEVELEVDPSRRQGTGPARYTLRRSGKELSSRELSKTTWKAAVANDGTVVGVVYTAGGSGGRDPGDLEVVRLTPGAEAFEVVHTRPRRPGGHHEWPSPTATGVFVQEALDRFVVRVEDHGEGEGNESWWPFELSSCRRLETFRPARGLKSLGSLQVVDVAPVPTSELCLVHWTEVVVLFVGARYTLLDRAGDPVWELALPGDYGNPLDLGRGPSPAAERVFEEGGIRTVSEDGFEVLFAKDEARVSFLLAEEGEGWKVEEVSRAPLMQPAGPAPKRRLEALGAVLLDRDAPAETPFAGVRSFDFCPGGDIVFLRSREGDAVVRCRPDGEVLGTWTLPGAPEDRPLFWTSIRHLGDGRFALLRTGYGRDERADVWSFDAESGELDELAVPACRDRAQSLAPLGDGGFAVLADSKTWTFDAEGSPQALGDGSGADIGPALSIAPFGGDRLALLRSPIPGIWVFDPASGRGPSRRIPKSKNRVPHALTDLAPDVGGGLVALDQDTADGEPPTLFRLGSDLTLTAILRPRFADGRPFLLVGGARVAPNGDLWVSDGHALLSLDEEGVVERHLGEAPSTPRLGRAAAVAIGPRDGLYAVSRRSGAIHRMTPDGRTLRVLEPEPGDLPLNSLWRGVGVSVEDDGHVAVGVRDGDWTRFAPDGERLGRVAAIGGTVTGIWIDQPGTQNTWVCGSRAVWLVGPDGETVTTITKEPKGPWLSGIQSASVAPDGSIAVLTGSTDIVYDHREPAVHLYDAAGEPIRSIDPELGLLAFPSIAFDGEHIVLGCLNASPEAVLVLDANGRRVAEIVQETPARIRGKRVPLLPRHADEVWIWDGNRTVHRFALR